MTITAEGGYGALSPDGMSGYEGNPDGTIDLTGRLKLPGIAGNLPYTLPGVFIGGSKPNQHRLTVIKGKTPVASVTFYPILKAGETVLDINALIAENEAQTASREQLLSLAAGLDTLDAKAARADADHTASVQSLADTAQDRLLSQQATDAANAAAAAIGATGLVALRVARGVVRLSTFGPTLITTVSRPVTLIGTRTVPRLEIA